MATTLPSDIALPPLTSQMAVDFLCSRARAATIEARSEHRRSGPAEYYAIWLARMAPEMVGPSTCRPCMI